MHIFRLAARAPCRSGPVTSTLGIAIPEAAIVRTNYVMVDYENVQPNTLDALAGDHFKVLLFVGAGQTKISLDIAQSLQRLGSRGEYVRVTGSAKDALDFHIAFYIGRMSIEDPSGYFHIISRDTGFDPLIQHLKSKKISAVRSKSVDDIPLLKAANSKTLPEKVSVVVSNLKQRGASKPRALKTLASTLASLFQKQLQEAELQELIQELQSQGLVIVAGTKVTYALPDGDA